MPDYWKNIQYSITYCLTSSSGCNSVLIFSNCALSSLSLRIWCSRTFRASYSWFTRFLTSLSRVISSVLSRSWKNKRMPLSPFRRNISKTTWLFIRSHRIAPSLYYLQIVGPFRIIYNLPQVLGNQIPIAIIISINLSTSRCLIVMVTEWSICLQTITYVLTWCRPIIIL